MKSRLSITKFCLCLICKNLYVFVRLCHCVYMSLCVVCIIMSVIVCECHCMYLCHSVYLCHCKFVSLFFCRIVCICACGQVKNVPKFFNYLKLNLSVKFKDHCVCIFVSLCLYPCLCKFCACVCVLYMVEKSLPQNQKTTIAPITLKTHKYKNKHSLTHMHKHSITHNTKNDKNTHKRNDTQTHAYIL